MKSLPYSKENVQDNYILVKTTVLKHSEHPRNYQENISNRF